MRTQIDNLYLLSLLKGHQNEKSSLAHATVSAVVSITGIASGHLVKRSTQMGKYVNPCDGGSGLTMSMWTWLKHAPHTVRMML